VDPPVTPEALRSRATAALDALDAGMPPQVLRAHYVDVAEAALELADQIDRAVIAERRRLPATARW
jgi:hypothetical protein